MDGDTDLLLTMETMGNSSLVLYSKREIALSMQVPALSRPALVSVTSNLHVSALINLNFTPTLLIYTQNGFFPVTLSAFLDPTCENGPIFPLSEPHSAASIDLNGDCLSDLFLTVCDSQGNRYFQVLLNAKNGNYCLVLTEKVGNSTGQVTFADVNKDGKADLLFPVGNDRIHILFNSNSASHTCEFDENALRNFTLLDLNSEISTEWKEILDLPLEMYPGTEDFPATIRLSDMDLDGYPDLLVTLQGENGPEVVYFHNTNGRVFDIDSNAEYEKIRETGGEIGGFFDLDENGVMDVLVTWRNDSGVRVRSYYNNLVEDTFHIKAVMRDGSSYSAYPGAVFTYTVTDMDMNSLYYRCTQLPLTAWFSLSPPFCLAGTGRTVTYIENLYAALPLAEHSSRMWTPIIPNSDLSVVPSAHSTEDWELLLFANPSRYLVPIIATSLSLLALLGAFILWRYGKERKMDRVRHRLS